MNGVELVASWLTPAVLFCVLNLMIGTIFVISGLKHHNNPPKASENDPVSPPQLVRVPSFFERVNSIKLSFSRDTVHHEDVPNRDQPRQSPESSDFHVTRSKSDTGAKASRSGPGPAAVTKKSSSEKFQAAEKEGGKISELGGTGDETVDARADDFINRFRQQLKMQRLDSLLRYKEMSKRRGGT